MEYISNIKKWKSLAIVLTIPFLFLVITGYSLFYFEEYISTTFNSISILFVFVIFGTLSSTIMNSENERNSNLADEVNKIENLKKEIVSELNGLTFTIEDTKN